MKANNFSPKFPPIKASDCINQCFLWGRCQRSLGGRWRRAECSLACRAGLRCHRDGNFVCCAGKSRKAGAWTACCDHRSNGWSSRRLHSGGYFQLGLAAGRVRCCGWYFYPVCRAGRTPGANGWHEAGGKTRWLAVVAGLYAKTAGISDGWPSAVENLYTSAMLCELFADWEIISLREHEDTIAEGNAHVGRSALIDLVARKPTDR